MSEEAPLAKEATHCASSSAAKEWEEKVASEFDLLEPKEEPLDNFLESDEKETMDYSKEPKEEPLDIFPSFATEIPQLTFMGEYECKKEEMLDFEDILPQDGAANKLEENDISTMIPVEPKFEVLEDRVVISVQNPKDLPFCDDFNDTTTPAENNSGIHQLNIHSQKLFNESFENPQCIHCEMYPSTVYGYTSHLRRYHYTTLDANGIYLICSCGAEVYRNSRDLNHTRECSGIEFTLHKLCDKARIDFSPKVYRNSRDPNDIIEGAGIEFALHSLYETPRIDLSQEAVMNFVPSTPQCILCEEYPCSIYAYMHHLYFQHKSSLNTNGVFLRCSCGSVEWEHHDSSHRKRCSGVNFSLLKVKKNIPSTPQCILCEKYPPTTHTYANHLASHHRSTLNANEIYLLCSCGEQVRSCYISNRHKNECSGFDFSIAKVKKMIPSTTQCILCENYPTTAHKYAQHLASSHQSSLNMQAVYLQCSCGEQIRVPNRSFRHLNQCDARQFTIEWDIPREISNKILNAAEIANYHADHCYALPRR